MPDVAELPRTETGTAIALIVSETPVVVLTDKERRAEFYAHIQAEVDAFEPDVSTAKGRDAIKSLAYKITRTKTAIDAAGKELNEEARQRINAVDAERRAARDHLDGLAKKVRQPLTEWEEAEKAREADVDRIITMFRSSRFVEAGEGADHIRERGTLIYQTALDPGVFQDRLDEAQREKDDTVAHLKAALDRAVKAEEEAAELHRLREEAEAREREAAAKREAEEVERQQQEVARAAEEARIAAENAEKERLARAAEEAADKARREAEEAAQRERDEERRQHEAALAAEREARKNAEREAQAERDRIAREEAARVEAERREAEAKAKREADQAHRTAVKTKAKEAIISCGADEETAKKIVMAIIAGEIPAVRMEF
ncbi:hypothetical protein [Sphingopyxis sp. NJF-3]